MYKAEEACQAALYNGREPTSPGREAWITAPGGSTPPAKLHLNSALKWGDLHIPLSRPAFKALQDLVTFSCTTGKNGPGGGCRQAACAPRNQSSSLERSGEGGGLRCSPTLSTARESIAVSSRSNSGNATLPDGGSTAES